MTTSESIDSKIWDDLVDRLGVHDIRYLMGGRQEPSATCGEVPLGPLILDLTRSGQARLRDALIALLLRHPDAAKMAKETARTPAIDDPTRRFLLVSLVVSAALQQEWDFSLGLYLPDQIPIEVGHVAAEPGLPDPREDFGRTCLSSAAELLRRGAPFPFNYRTAWQDTVHRLLAQLAVDARHGRA